MQRSLLLSSTARARRAPVWPILAKGFRPFFLLAAAYAVLMVPLWLAIVQGALAPGSYLEPVAWHAHEMLAGVVTAVVAGFLLTAVGNWTERETATGGALAGLVALWLAGRLGLLFAASLPRGAAALLDLAFLPALALRLAPPLFASRNRRNFVMLAIVAALFVANLLVHLAALGWLSAGAARRGNLLALDVLVLLISIIGGRVFPMFTRNATGVSSIRSLPSLDRASVAALVALSLVDALWPDAARLGAAVAALAGLLSLARAWHWGAQHAWREPLLWILHVGYAWLVIGLLLRGAGLLGVALGSSAVHALTVGAIGSLVLGMMARVSLGHTGRMLAAPRPMASAFAAITLAAVVRCFVPLLAPAYYRLGLLVAGAAWTLAFAVFLLVYAPLLVSPRVDGRPG